jgi:hypothetical protein
MWSTRIRRRRAAIPVLPVALLMIPVALLVIPALLATCQSLLLWGYAFRPPGIDPLANQLVTITAVTEIAYAFDPTHGYQLQQRGVPDITTRANAYRQAPDLPGERILAAIDARIPSPDALPPLADTLVHAFDTAARQQQLQFGMACCDSATGAATGYHGVPYESYHTPRGYLVQGHSATGAKLLLAGVTSGQVANDQYRHYEFLFQETDREPPLTVLAQQRFDYGLAGIEFLQWPLLFLLNLTVTLIVAGGLIYPVYLWWVWAR